MRDCLSLQPLLDHIDSLDDLTVELAPRVTIYCGGLPCGGYFDSGTGSICVAVKRPFDIWAGTLSHEYSHYEQWREGTSEWSATTLPDGTDVSSLIDEWLSGSIELDTVEVSRYMRIIASLELDCERRSLENISRWEIPLDKHKYAVMANAYVLSHEVAWKHRVWLKPQSLSKHFTTLEYLFPDSLHSVDCYADPVLWSEAFDFLRSVCMGPVSRRQFS